MSEIFAHQHFFITEDMEFSSKISRQFVYLLKHITYNFLHMLLLLFLNNFFCVWIFYVGIKFCKFKFSPGFIFAGLNFMNFFYNRKKQEIKDAQN